MDIETLLIDAAKGSLVYILLAILFIVLIYKAVNIVPQSEKHVVERFGRLHALLGPGINMIVPFLVPAQKAPVACPASGQCRWQWVFL